MQIASNRARTRSLRVLNNSILILLAAQFFVGIFLNLFVAVPSAHPGAEAPEYFSGVFEAVVWTLSGAPLWLIIHASLGVLLFVLSLLLLIFASVARRGSWIIVAIIGFLGIIGAGFNGASFINYGHDVSSLIMAICFLLAAIPYIIAISFSR